MEKPTARRITNCLMALCAICLIMFSPLIVNSQDPWANFQPGLIKSYGCKVRSTTISINGMDHGEDAWQAIAFAVRPKDNWEWEVARYPLTLKGRHKAEKACSKWQDKAEKRVYGAQGK